MTSLAIYNNYLYVSVKRNEHLPVSSRIWRAKKPTNSSSFEITSNWQEYLVANSDILSMIFTKAFIYLGYSDGFLRRCLIDHPYMCQAFGKRLEKSSITKLDYNPEDYRVYAVRSVLHSKGKFSSQWFHQLMRCSSETPNSCTEVSIGLKGWAILQVAFDALWIADAGLIRKCPFNQMKENFTVDYGNCFRFDDFESPTYINIAASSRYLYVRSESSRYIWHCDPDRRFSCLKAFEVPHENQMGPFVTV